MRKYPHIPDPYAPPKLRAGVYKPVANFPGRTVRLEVVNSDGDLMAVLTVDAEIATDSFERGFHRLLQREDTGKTIRVLA